MLNNKKIVIASLLILAISGLLTEAVSAEAVSPGERIRFIAKNSSESVGAMEGITTDILSVPSFVIAEDAASAGTISKGGADEAVDNRGSEGEKTSKITAAPIAGPEWGVP